MKIYLEGGESITQWEDFHIAIKPVPASGCRLASMSITVLSVKSDDSTKQALITVDERRDVSVQVVDP